MKKKKWLLGLGLVVLVIGFFVINYTKPMTISEFSQCLEITEYHSIRGSFSIGDSVDDSSFTTSAPEELDAIFELFSDKTFSKSLVNFLPQDDKIHRVEDDDFQWSIVFRSDRIILQDGNSISGDILTISNFYGELEIHFDDETYICTTDNQEEWLKNVVDLLSDLE